MRRFLGTTAVAETRRRVFVRGVVAKAVDKTAQDTEINARNKKGETSLHEAVRSGTLPAVRNLLAAGADSHVPSTKGETPLDIARKAIQSAPDPEEYKEIARAIKESDLRRFEERLAGYKDSRPSSGQIETDTRRYLSTKAVQPPHILEMSEVIAKGLQEVIERGNIEAIIEREVSKNPVMDPEDNKEIVARVVEILSSANKEGSLVKKILETGIEECLDSEDYERLGDASYHTKHQYFNNIVQAIEAGVKKRNHEYLQGGYDGLLPDLLKNGSIPNSVSKVGVSRISEEEFLHGYEKIIIEALENCVSIYATSLFLESESRSLQNRASPPLSTGYSEIARPQKRSLSSGPGFSDDQAKLDLETAADLSYYDKNGLNDIARRNGFTKLKLLDYAVRHNSHSAVMFLMLRGSFRKLVNEALEDGKTPLQRAIDCGLSYGGVAHNLIKHSDPPIDLANDYGQEITSKLVKLRSLSTLVMALKIFNEGGGDIQSVGDNILFEMVSQGNSYDIAYHFLKKGVSSSYAVDCDGNSIVFKTIEAMQNTGPDDVDKNYESFLNALLEDIDVEQYDYNGIYPLNYAVEKENYPAVCALLKLGAKTNILNESGETVLDIALGSVSVDIVKRLIEAGAKRPSNSPKETKGSDEKPLVGKKPLQK